MSNFKIDIGEIVAQAIDREMKYIINEQVNKATLEVHKKLTEAVAKIAVQVSQQIELSSDGRILRISILDPRNEK